ncbi:amino acid adenylation domain-containing protein [Plantactinospora sp. B5E13]|uniref:amino acid adenylation domain-containing protein n=1 Tax=Plantactinospora sp. B5E13 TaxID=3153758 RepID=UPI00325C9142
MFGDGSGTFQVVLNARGQRSVWPLGRQLPAGWSAEGEPTDFAAALAYVERAWTDLTPLPPTAPAEPGHPDLPAMARPDGPEPARTTGPDTAPPLAGQRSDPFLPLLWWPGGGFRGAPRPMPAPEAGDPGEELVTALAALLLRYGTARDLHLTLRGEDRREDLRLPYSALGPVDSALGPTLSAIRQAVRTTRRAAGGGDIQGTLRLRPQTGEPDDERQPWLVLTDGSLRWEGPDSPVDPQGPDRVLAHLLAFVHAARTAAETPVGLVPILTPGERDLIARVNATGRPEHPTPLLHRLVEEAAARYPTETAVVHGEVRLTFAELDARAAALAAALVARGAGPNRRVGVLATRGAEFVVAVLGVLKAGAAYVPLDPGLPPARLATLHRLGAVVDLVAEERHADRARGLGADPLVLGVSDPVDGTPAAAPAAVAPDDLAYVIFTSGSSGEPKAALLDHRGRVNMIEDLNSRFALGPGDRSLVVSSPSFDMSVYDILGTLAAGATVLLPDRDLEYDVRHWAELADREGATVWHSVPSSMEIYLRTVGDRAMGRFRLFLLGGDWIPVDQPARLRRLFPDCRVVSLGGATEVSVDSVVYEVTDACDGWRSVPYGHPLANQTAYVVDGFGGLAGVDQVGELVLGGVGVGWGYDGRAGFTAERFVPDPFGPPGGRLYRTGDAARLRPDGDVELLGRLDQQVKIGGVRIELGEIQAVLREHPAVADTVVVPRRAADGRARSLAGFVVARPGVDLDGLTDRLRGHLVERLPATMVPAQLTVLDALPVNVNGKVDRRALEAAVSVSEPGVAGRPGPDAAGDAGAVSGGPGAADEVTDVVAQVWADVLGLPERPTAQSSFLDLGGGSLAAIQVANRLSRRFAAEVRVADLYTAQTVAEVAAVVRRRSGSAAARPTLTRRTGGRPT